MVWQERGEGGGASDGTGQVSWDWIPKAGEAKIEGEMLGTKVILTTGWTSGQNEGREGSQEAIAETQKEPMKSTTMEGEDGSCG